MSPKVAAAPQKYKRAKFAPKLSKAAAERLNHVPHSVASEDSPKRKAKAKATTKTEDTPEALPSTFKIIAGSYEKLLYGLEGSSTAAGSSYTFSFKPVFIFPAHISSVRAVAASPQGGKWLATGSGDEIVKVWDLRRRKEIGGLMHHEGSITHLEFPSRSHLLSASEDGTLCLFHARDWAVLRSLKGHKGRVNSVAVHPSGKVALSVGKDRTLRMWDLMRGKGSASTKLGKEAEVVRWSTDGSLFVVLTQSTIDIYNTDMSLLHTITHPSRLHSVRFCKRVVGDGEVLLVAAEDKKVSVYDIPFDVMSTPTIVAEMVGHTNRVKAVETLAIALPHFVSDRQSTTVVSTISSDGKIHLYDMAALPSSSNEKAVLQPVAEYDTKGTRLTCLAMADGEVTKTAVNTKRKRDVDDVDESSGDEDGVWGSQQEGSKDDEDEDEEDEEDE
ncbi:hypothetical protein IEO21_02232 [Rhodonia placenta]|uniref:WD40 repeat-like protein n=1 Tax=Rhodonia placenta TaxID=104341 RepID=A0A8H7P822_9APHY|nr:hypothetical protein IEO21_02232 [Postia placenta]